jgi:hypothetical protein
MKIVCVPASTRCTILHSTDTSASARRGWPVVRRDPNAMREFCLALEPGSAREDVRNVTVLLRERVHAEAPAVGDIVMRLRGTVHTEKHGRGSRR